MERRADTRVVIELREPCFQFLAKWDLVEVAESQSILFVDPGFRLGRGFVFEPAIRIVNLRAEIVVDLFDFLGYGVDELRIICGRTRAVCSARRRALRAGALKKRQGERGSHK